MLSLESAIPDSGIVRIDDLADRNDLGILLPLLIFDFVFGLSFRILRQTRICVACRSGLSGSRFETDHERNKEKHDEEPACDFEIRHSDDLTGPVLYLRRG